MLTRSRKAELIKDLSDKFGKSKAAFLVDFKGMDVEQVTQLRKNLVEVGAELKVVRNSLAIRALSDHPDEEKVLADKLVGTNAFVFAYEEPPAPAKAITEFAKTVEALKVKSGVMSGAELSADRIKFLGTLPGKDELRATLLATLQAPATNLARVLQAVPQGLVTVLKAYHDKENK